jgi:hypothetical protein
MGCNSTTFGQFFNIFQRFKGVLLNLKQFNITPTSGTNKMTIQWANTYFIDLFKSEIALSQCFILDSVNKQHLIVWISQ